MFPVRPMIVINFLKVMDVVTILLCLVIVAHIGLDFETPPHSLIPLQIRVSTLIAVGSSLVGWHLLFLSLRLYDCRRIASWRDEVGRILLGNTGGVLFMVVAEYFVGMGTIGLEAIVTFWTLTTASAILLRYAASRLLRLLGERAHNLRNVLIVGADQRALDFERRISRSPELGYRVIGFASDAPSISAAPEGPPAEEGNHRIVTTIDDLPSYLRREALDEVVVCLPIRSCARLISEVISACETQGVPVRILSNGFGSRSGVMIAEQLGDDASICLQPTRGQRAELALKYAIDFVVAALLLIVLAPVFLLVAALLKASSPGPVIFRQDRVGYNKRLFKLYKFRTMYVGAEAKLSELERYNECDGAAFKMRNDPRVTRIGSLLRKTSLDELPQLVNVLKGEMSLVGPRPLPLRDYERFNQDWHRRRFSVRPGITCICQMKGRSDVPFSDWMKMDIEYIENWSLNLDLSILLGTIPAVLRGRGAV